MSTKAGSAALRRFPGMGPIAWFALAFLYIPMIAIVGYAFNSGDRALVWEGFSTVWFTRIFANPEIVDSTIVSFKLAFLAMVISTAMALGIALVLERYSTRGRAIALSLITAPLIIPEIVAGVATLGFIRIVGIHPGFTALLLAHVAFCIPFALLPIRARLGHIDKAVFEAGADLGATDWKLFRRVTLPVLMPGLVSGALLAFIISLDDFIISSFLSSADTTTLPIYLFGLIRKGVSPAVNAVSTVLLLLSALIVTATYLLTQRRDRT
jgi:spermidine/putrescine transport system permease protein